MDFSKILRDWGVYDLLLEMGGGVGGGGWGKRLDLKWGDSSFSQYIFFYVGFLFFKWNTSIKLPKQLKYCNDNFFEIERF